MFKIPKLIIKELEEYNQTVQQYLEGKISSSRFFGIRVPWGNYSHRGGKIFMSRVRIPAGRLQPEQLKILAECSKKYGKGSLHITTRQDIQIHGIEARDISAVHNSLKPYQLSSRGGGGNTVRNITASPLAGIHPEEPFDVSEDAVALSEKLLSYADNYRLPRKIKISFSGYPQDNTGVLANDIGFLAITKNHLCGYRVYTGGGMGAQSAKALVLEDFITRDQVIEVVTAIIRVFFKHGDRKNKHHNRLRFFIRNTGFERFKELYLKERQALQKNPPSPLRKIQFSYPAPSGNNRIKQEFFQEKEGRDFLKYNCVDQKQQGLKTVKLRIPQGDLRWFQAQQLATISQHIPGLEFRTTPAQNLYLTNIPASKLHLVYQKVKEISADFFYPETLADISVCKGATTCNLGLCDSPALARKLEEIICKNFTGTPIFETFSLNINGCPNACGRHPLGNLALQGAVRKVEGRPIPCYRFYIGGLPIPDSFKLAKDSGIILPAIKVPLFLKEVLSYLNQFNETELHTDDLLVDRVLPSIKKMAENFSSIPPYSKDKSFYRDIDKKEDFTLAGIGPGECGAGVLNIIEADLEEADQHLKAAEKNGNKPTELQAALFLSARALLIVRGIEPRTPYDTFSHFQSMFIDKGIASPRYADLKEVYRELTSPLSSEDRKRRKDFVQSFYEHIQELYNKMDASFQFPHTSEGEKEKKRSHIYDLTGTPCPINYVKAKMYLEELDPETKVTFLVDEGEPIQNVPPSLENDGHTILNITKTSSHYKVNVLKSKN